MDNNRYRSGLERQAARQLNLAGCPFRYEEVVINYLKPQKFSRYTPDFILPNGIIVETKGRFLTPDRQKMLLVKEQHPDLDIRFVFSSSRSKISKQSKTTYAMWCTSKGFPYADQTIPTAWIQEPPSKRSLAAIKKL